ncbi:MAG TPA: FG-GAP repeat protein, partial [Phototrophicaceae bacterium]|nr:FG-GAP repeat protein [Phototrophicaceae bacterium]
MLLVQLARAQQLAPAPLPENGFSPRVSSELLVNGGFEADTDADKIPDDWTAKNTQGAKSDKRKCDLPGKAVAHGGSCAFMFRGNANGTASKIQQTVTDASALVDQSEITFSAFIDPRSGVVGAKIGKVVIILSDGSSQKLQLQLPETVTLTRATADYLEINDAQILTLSDGVTATKIKIQLKYGEKTGKFYLDYVNLSISLPDTSTPTPSNTPSAIPSSTATDTSTSTPTSTPTMYPTGSPTSAFGWDKLTAEDGEAGDYFGYPVAINKSILAFGATGDDAFTGAVYIFGSVNSHGVERQKLTASDAAEGDAFGYSIALDLDHENLAVGTGNSDAVYIFTYDGIGWAEQQKLTASDNDPGEKFGRSVALDGTTLIVGKYGDNSEQGLAYIFTNDGNSWIEQQKLIASDGIPGDRFGQSVALDGNTLLIGADGVENNQGAVYVFGYDGSSWVEQKKLIPGDAVENSYFGEAVALYNGDRALIGASGWNSNTGSAYIFIFDGSNWVELQKITPDNGSPGDEFGRAVALNNRQLLIGAHGNENQTGAAYFYRPGSGNWVLDFKIVPDGSEPYDQVGGSVAMDNYSATTGAFGDDNFRGA